MLEKNIKLNCRLKDRLVRHVGISKIEIGDKKLYSLIILTSRIKNGLLHGFYT